MIQMANPIQELLRAVYSCISDFNCSYKQISKAPREEWASMMDRAFSSVLSHHMEILNCSKVVADSTDTHLYESLVPETFTMAINTAANLHLKAMRNEVFRVMSEQLTAQAQKELHKWDPPSTLTYSFAEYELRELSYLIPGQNGWVHICPNSKLEGFLNNHKGEQFSLELQVSESSTIQYGLYRASIMPGQAMSGLEFAQLSQNTRNKVAKSLCGSETGEQEESSLKFREVMEDLLHSRIALACIFLECIQGPVSPNTSFESLSAQDIQDEPAPAYLHEDSLLPTLDSVPGYFPPRLTYREPNLGESENEVEAVDSVLLDFSRISNRRWNTRARRWSSPPFGVIGEMRRSARTFTTSTPNISDSVDSDSVNDEDGYYDDDDDDDDVSPSDGARTPIAVSFSFASTSEWKETSSSFSVTELSYGGARNVREPLRSIYFDGQISKDCLRLNSSFPGWPPRKSDFEIDESSFNQNMSDSHINYNDTNDITSEDISKDFSFMKIVEDETSFVRPSSALANLLSGSGRKNAGEDTSLSVPDSPIWNSCGLRRMISAPAFPRRAIVENMNERR